MLRMLPILVAVMLMLIFGVLAAGSSMRTAFLFSESCVVGRVQVSSYSWWTSRPSSYIITCTPLLIQTADLDPSLPIIYIVLMTLSAFFITVCMWIYVYKGNLPSFFELPRDLGWI